uniref:Solute carrier organic anion transporter family member n=1 Tax=Meloidogyne enterolobii TaxID=390850 RepID=A0A6V7VXD1_MELEN|nr:unnamed protein product [Meloidogyne enterolobii]
MIEEKLQNGEIISDNSTPTINYQQQQPGTSSNSFQDGNIEHSNQLKTTPSFKSVYDEDIDDIEAPLRCGVGSCTPDWLQKLHTAKWLLLFLGICAFNQSFVINAIFPVDLSTLEKRFHMTSTQTGIISSWYDLAVLLVVFPVCHWGNIGHKGRWIGIGSLIMGFGSFISAMPHFISSPWPIDNLNSSDYGQCTNRIELNEHCESRRRGLLDAWYMNPYFLIFLLGQTFHGFGATPLFSLGTAYLDENVSQKSSPVYLAIHSMLTSIGPIFGLFIGGRLLQVYEDFDRVDLSTVPMKNSRDPRWVGAWWVGFLCCAIASGFISIPIMLFARELPEAKKHRLKDVNQVHANSQMDANDHLLKEKKNFSQLMKGCLNILRNPTFVAVMAIGNFEAIILNGFSAFMPKILETILSTTPTIGSYLSSVVIFAAAGGVMIGGMVVRQMNLQVGGMLKMILICHLVALVLITCLLVQCPSREFVGITLGYDRQKPKPGVTPSLIAQCNSQCHCTNKWNPVCDKSTGLTYFSACYAGCEYKEEIHSLGTVWRNCHCIADINRPLITTTTPRNITTSFNLTENPFLDSSPSMASGFCTKDCGWSLYLFLVLLFFSVVASFAAGIPNQQIMLRVIPFHQRTLGIAVNWTFHRLLGFIPGGILFGFMIDTTCQKWQHSDCGTRQSCLVHDQYRLAWTIMAVAVVCKLMAVLATIIGYVTYRPNDLDSAMSVQTTDSRGPLSLVVNDDRPKQASLHTTALSTDSTASALHKE